MPAVRRRRARPAWLPAGFRIADREDRLIRRGTHAEFFAVRRGSIWVWIGSEHAYWDHDRNRLAVESGPYWHSPADLRKEADHRNHQLELAAEWAPDSRVRVHIPPLGGHPAVSLELWKRHRPTVYTSSWSAVAHTALLGAKLLKATDDLLRASPIPTGEAALKIAVTLGDIEFACTKGHQVQWGLFILVARRLGFSDRAIREGIHPRAKFDFIVPECPRLLIGFNDHPAFDFPDCIAEHSRVRRVCEDGVVTAAAWRAVRLAIYDWRASGEKEMDTTGDDAVALPRAILDLAVTR